MQRQAPYMKVRSGAFTAAPFSSAWEAGTNNRLVGGGDNAERMSQPFRVNALSTHDSPDREAALSDMKMPFESAF